MSRAKVFSSILMVLILITLSGVSVWAAPGREEPTATPTETPEPTEEPIVEATEEPTLEPTDEPDEEPLTEHPVALALTEFFEDVLGLEDDTIMSYHEDGMGFGVIAQACWMAYDALEGDATLLDQIIEAKKSGDFSSIVLPDGTEITATNWGQFRKEVLLGKGKNLGAIMSGRAEKPTPETEAAAKHGKGKNGKDKSKTEPPGQEKDKGGGKPDTPPGKDKGSGKDKGGDKGKGK